MALIRQEINLLTTNYSGANVAIAPNEIVGLDSLRYSGTVTFYFEIEGTATAATTGSVRLKENGSDKLTFSTSNLGTGATLFRSTSFTPTAGLQSYTMSIDAGGTGKTVTLKAARIIVIQDDASFTSSGITETQIEVGSLSTITALAAPSTTTNATNPKYWKYTAANWNAISDVFFEAVFKGSTSKTPCAVTLQVDDGSFGTWTQVAAVTTTSTTPTRIRSASFTPVAGRNYRVVGAAAESKTGMVLYSAKIIINQGYDATLYASQTITSDRVAKLTSTRVVVGPVGGNLKAFDLSGTTWSQVGSSFSIVSGVGAICGLSTSRVAVFDNNGNLRAFDFNGSTFSQVGNALNISPVGTPITISALSATRIAWVSSGTTLRAYDFDGTTWTLTGSALTIGASASAVITALSSTDIALFDAGVPLGLRTYTFNGSTWSQVGSAYAVAISSAGSITALSSTQIAFTDTGCKTYDFNGSVWTQTNNNAPVLPGSSAAGAQVALSSTRFVAFCGASTFATIDIDSTATAPTLLEPQYLLANTAFSAGTALQTFLTKWDSAEWTTTNVYTHQLETNVSANVVELDTAAGTQLTGSPITTSGTTSKLYTSGAVTMPANGNLDTKATTNNGGVFANRILVAVTASAGALTFTPAAGSLALTTYAPTVSLGFTPASGSVVTAGLAPTQITSLLFPVGAGTLVTATTTPSFDSGFTPTTATLTVTGQAVELERHECDPAAGSIALSGLVPTLSFTALFSPDPAALALVGLAPLARQSVVMTPDAGALTTATYAESVNLGLVPSVGALAMSGVAPDLVRAYVLFPDPAALVLTGFMSPVSAQHLLLSR
jgi:hypothetical protein